MKQNITAIIYDRKGNVLSIGKNSYVKTHPLQAHYAQRVGLGKKIYLHAEINAIIKLRQPEKAYKMLIIRTLANGTYGCAKPCPICTEAITTLFPSLIVEHT